MGTSFKSSKKFESVAFSRLYYFPEEIFEMASGALKRFIPMLDRVLVQRAEAVTKSKGGILIPEKAQSKVLEGTVVAAGPGARNADGAHVPMGVEVGDKVLL